VSILHIESFQNRSDAGLLPKTDGRGSAGAGTVFLAVDFDAEELACKAEFGDLVFSERVVLTSIAVWYSLPDTTLRCRRLTKASDYYCCRNPRWGRPGIV
jgi:hypothetical protein